MRGTCAVYFEQKGFGFIKPDNGDHDVFVHISDIQGGIPLQKGDLVDFETGTSHRNGKLCARNVRPISVRLNQPVQFGDRQCAS